MKKRIEKGRVFVFDEYVGPIDGTFEEIIEQLHRWAFEYKVGLQDISYYYDSYDGFGAVSYYRDMTEKEKADEEKKRRKDRERAAKSKAAKEAKEKAELQRLLNKYGNV